MRINLRQVTTRYEGAPVPASGFPGLLYHLAAHPDPAQLPHPGSLSVGFQSFHPAFLITLIFLLYDFDVIK